MESNLKVFVNDLVGDCNQQKLRDRKNRICSSRKKVYDNDPNVDYNNLKVHCINPKSRDFVLKTTILRKKISRKIR